MEKRASANGSGVHAVTQSRAGACPVSTNIKAEHRTEGPEGHEPAAVVEKNARPAMDADNVGP